MVGINQWQNWKSINDALSDIEFKVYTTGDCEVDYVDDMVNAYKKINSNSRGERVSTEVYKTHGHPHATFDIPSKSSKQTCEIADLCFDV
jgi:hypothetical protein